MVSDDPETCGQVPISTAESGGEKTVVRDVIWATGKSPGRSIHFPILALLSRLHPQPVVAVG